MDNLVEATTEKQKIFRRAEAARRKDRRKKLQKFLKREQLINNYADHIPSKVVTMHWLAGASFMIVFLPFFFIEKKMKN